MSTLEFPTTTMRLRVLPNAEPLTWDEARRLAHCRVVWKACKRAEEKAQEQEREERRARRIKTFWLLVVLVSMIIGLGGLVYLAATETQAIVLLMASLVLLAISIHVTNRLDR